MALEYLGNIKFGSEPPKFPADSNGLAGLASGYVAGSEARMDRREAKEQAAKEKSETGTSTTKVPTFMDSLASAFLKAPGVEKAGADPLHEVRKLTAVQSAQMQALEIKDALDRRQRTLESKLAMNQFGAMIDGALVGDNPADAYGMISEYMARHPALFDTKEGQGMFRNYEKAIDLLNTDKVFEQRERIAKLHWGPEGASGRPEAMTRRMQQATAWEAEADAIQDFDEVGAAKLRQNAAGLRRAEPVAPAPLRTAKGYGELVAERAAMPPGTDTTEIDATIAKLAPGGTAVADRVRILTDKQASGIPLTPGETEELSRLKRPTTEVYGENLVTGAPEVKRVEGRVIQPADLKDRVIGLRKNTDVLGLIEDLERSSATDHVGTVPKIKKTLFDQILPQFGFDTSNPDRAVAQSQLTRFTQQGIRALNAEARLSNQDATMLMEAFPKIDSWLESPPRAAAMLNSFKRATAIGAVRDAKAAHRGVPPIAGQSLYLNDWFRLHEVGSLTYDEAVQLGSHFKSRRAPPTPR